MPNVHTQRGFTIIEIMIVMAIGALILIVVFLAVPELQRNTRNSERNQDAALLTAAINQCLATNGNSEAICSKPSNIPLNPSKDFIIFTGFWYGRNSDGSSRPPDENNPNYLFHLQCNASGTWFINVGGPPAVVTYVYETGNSMGNRCLDS